MSIWATKSIEQLKAEAAVSGEHSLKRVLGPINLVTLGIGAIIGTGIFVLTGEAAAQHAGPAIVLSMVLAGFASALAGLCYSEFASTIPIAGSAYTYGYATLGEFVAWIIGWDLILEYLFGASTVAVGWAGYFSAFMEQIGVHLPKAFTSAPYYYADANELDPVTHALIHPAGFSHVPGAVMNLPAVILIGLMSTLLVIGITDSARFNNFIVILKVTIVLLVIGFGFMYVNQANWHPFIPPSTGEYGHYGWSGIVRGAAVVFFAYIGFDAVSTAAQEAKNPQRDMPVGILGSLAVCTVLYILVALVLTGLVNYRNLDVRDPLAIGIDSTGVRWGSFLVKIGALMGLSSTIVVMLMGQSRVFFSMSRDGLLPSLFRAVHPRFRTPWISTLTVGLFVAVLAASLPINV